MSIENGSQPQPSYEELKHLLHEEPGEEDFDKHASRVSMGEARETAGGEVEPSETDKRIQESAIRVVENQTSQKRPYHPHSSQARSNADGPPAGQPDARRTY